MDAGGTSALIILFWAAFAAIGYTYCGYLFVLVAVDAAAQLRENFRFLRQSGDRRGDDSAETSLPTVSVLIAAHNEEAVIRAKLENTLALDYPPQLLQILVGSDGSTDNTEDIVRTFIQSAASSPATIELSAAPRGGKASVLNRLSQKATGELWLFTDANTWLEAGALQAMVKRLANSANGAVCGRLNLLRPGSCKLLEQENSTFPPSTAGPASQISEPVGGQASKVNTEGLYWQYENLLKLYESRRGALMGANGGLYLLRAELFEELPEDTIVDDFVITMRVLLQNRQVVFEPDAVGSEETASDLRQEFRRRVRIASGNFQSLRLLAPLLFMPSFASLAFFSHKILRWLVPWFMLLTLGSSFLLLDLSLYRLLFSAQLAFYLAAFISRQGLAPAPLRGVFRLAQYLVEMNLALALGLLRNLRGKHSAIWQRTERGPASGARRKVA